MQATMNKAPGTAAVQRPSATAWYIVSTEIAAAEAIAMETHRMVSSNGLRSQATSREKKAESPGPRQQYQTC
jgi:hypothetical protein